MGIQRGGARARSWLWYPSELVLCSWPLTWPRCRSSRPSIRRAPTPFWICLSCSGAPPSVVALPALLVHPSSSRCLTGPSFTTQLRGPISGPCSAGSCLWGSEQHRVWRRRTSPARALVTVSPVKAETVQRSKTQVVERETERDQGDFQRENQDSERLKKTYSTCETGDTLFMERKLEQLKFGNCESFQGMADIIK